MTNVAHVASLTQDKSWLEAWDIAGTVAYLRNKGFTRVTLQFPDELLEHSTVICAVIQQQCAAEDIPAQISILADTTYNALNVDEVAAQHAAADCVVHYGRASMSPLSCLPAYFVFGQQPVDVQAPAARIADYASMPGSEHKAAVVFMDQLLLHAASQLQAHVQQLQQSCQQTMQVLYAEVQGRTMDPVDPKLTVPLSQQPTDCKAQGNSSCCQGTPHATCAAIPDSHASAEPAEPAGHAGHAEPAEPAEPQRSQASATSEAGSSSLPQSAAQTDSSDLAKLDASHRSLSDSSKAHPAAFEHRQTNPGATSARLADSSTEGNCQPTDAQHQSNEAAEGAVDGMSSVAGGCVTGQIAGYTWTLPAGMQQEDCVMMWIGPQDAAALTHLQLTFNKSDWVSYDPEQDRWHEGMPLHISRTLKRRYFLVEKAKNANVIGILVGTLGVAGYRDAIDCIRSLAKKAGKKTYTMLMGKPNPAKLANLPEVEIFVMVADPQGMILDSKEYYAPIITPFEAYLAFSGTADWDGSYSLDFTSLQNNTTAINNGDAQKQPRFSLLDGSYHATGNAMGLEGEIEGKASTALAKRAQQALQLSGGQSQITSASEYLQNRRTFWGLEAPVVGAERKPVVKAVQGQTGRAAHYTHEAIS